MEEIEYTNTAIQEKIAKCKQMQQYAVQDNDKGKIMEACNNAMKLIMEIEGEITNMAGMVKQLETEE